MATQKHLNREFEGGLLFEDQCSPHAFLIDFKVSACHVFALLVHALAAIDAGSRPIAAISGSASTASTAGVIIPAVTPCSGPFNSAILAIAAAANNYIFLVVARCTHGITMVFFCRIRLHLKRSTPF
jgi:cytochrome c biogenesis protein CcdA